MTEGGNIKKYADRINVDCCSGGKRKRKYLLGYTGLKCCKVAMCLDCDKIQFVGNWVGKILYPIVRKIARNRIEVLWTIEIKPIFDEYRSNELKKYGRDKQ